jgi:nickel transport protein
MTNGTMRRMLRTSVCATIIAATMTISVAADAHGIWFAQRARQLALIYGIGADDLDMVRRLPRVESVTAYDADYQPIDAAARVAGPLVLIDADAQPTLVAAVMPYGVWSRVGDAEFEEKTLLEMPEATFSTKNVKYAVSIQGALSGPIPALAGHVLQIVPVGEIPATLGTQMTYRVLYNGAPQAGVRLINDMVNDPDAAEVRTGADGTVALPVRNQGLNVIRAVYEGPSDQPTLYHQIEHTATLAFTLAHLPE